MNKRIAYIGSIAIIALLVIALVVVLQNNEEQDTANEGENNLENENQQEDQNQPEQEGYEEVDLSDLSLSEHVKVNQVGYLPEHEKIALITASGQEFYIRDVLADEIIFRGELTEARHDAPSDDHVQEADFSSINIVGTYRVEVPEVGYSYSFDISESVYEDALISVMRSYTLQRCGEAIIDPVTGIEHEVCHLEDAFLAVGNQFHEEGAQLDVTGGWHDAGDYGKYMSPGAITVGQLLLAYDLKPDVFSVGQFMLPEGLSDEDNVGDLPDILREVKWKLDWMNTMQREDGAVYTKVSGKNWPGFELPERDTQRRYIFGVSSYGTAQYAAVMSMASRIYEPYDPAFAAEILERAELSLQFLRDTPQAFFDVDPDQDSGSGGYGKNADAEERLWAFAEHFRTTGEQESFAYIEENLSNHAISRPSNISWGNAKTLGQWALWNAQDIDEETKEKIEHHFIDGAKFQVLKINTVDPYRSALGDNDYIWASAKIALSYAVNLILTYEMDANDELLEAALDQLHWVLGRNASNYTFVTGIGEQYPENPHHRLVAATDILIPGLMVGGPNAFNDDPELSALDRTIPKAKRYLDHDGSWASNEYAIDYNAPLAVLLAYFNDHLSNER